MKAMHSAWEKFAAQILCVFCLLASGIGASKSAPSVTWQPQKLVNGSPVLFELRGAPGIRAITANWLGHELSFFRGTEANSWYALAGIPVEQAPGSYELKIVETRSGAKAISLVRRLKIGKARYPKITIKVARKFTEPNPEQLKEALADKQVKQKAFAAATPERLWSGSFARPVSDAISDIFGTARVFNGEVKSRHQGLDFAAPAGTPVHAINDGTVVLARALYFEGNFVVIDHGQGLMSLYLHLSEIKVKEGEEVKSGQTLGLSGGTGRASGPHLHLAVRWQGVYLDPATLLKIKIPAVL